LGHRSYIISDINDKSYGKGMAISEAPVYCANCRSPVRLSIRPSLGVPRRVPLFCSEQYARAYLEDMK
jgi:hypothetical protein